MESTILRKMVRIWAFFLSRVDTWQDLAENNSSYETLESWMNNNADDMYLTETVTERILMVATLLMMAATTTTIITILVIDSAAAYVLEKRCSLFQ